MQFYNDAAHVSRIKSNSSKYLSDGTGVEKNSATEIDAFQQVLILLEDGVDLLLNEFQKYWVTKLCMEASDSWVEKSINTNTD